MDVEHFQNLVIGSGEAGKFLAWNLAKRGQKTAVVERSLIGGSCPNIACLPSKNIIHSAKAISLVDPVNGLGVVSGSVKVDMAGVSRRKREMVDGLTDLHLSNFKASGAQLVMGEARFTATKTVEIKLVDNSTRMLSGDRFFLCVGSRASIPDVPGLAEAEPMTHVEALNLERLPEHLVIIGGGYVGLEFAQAMRRFGSKVTIIQHESQLLGREDTDVSAAILDLMRDDGIEVFLDTDVLAVSGRSGARVAVKVRSGTLATLIDATDILIAAGRVPNTDRLNVDAAGIKLNARGYVRVNERLQTSAIDVWAMGDCAGSPQFTHAGYDDFRVVLSGLDGGSRTTRDRLVPYCLFTDPELAHVGMSELEARAKNISYRLFTLPMSKVMRTRTLSQTRGFMKALIGSDDRILGFTAYGAEASELMAAVQIAMVGGMPYTALRDTIFTHPTISEGLIVLFTTGLKDASANVSASTLSTVSQNAKIQVAPPFDLDSATLKVRLAEDAWNSRDPDRVSMAYTEDSVWRNRSEFVTGRVAIRAFLANKWEREHEYRLVKSLWGYKGNRMAVRFQYEWHDAAGNWHRSYGNELWEFDEHGLMRRREASINDVPIPESDRRFFWSAPGPRPADHPGIPEVQ